MQCRSLYPVLVAFGLIAAAPSAASEWTVASVGGAPPVGEAGIAFGADGLLSGSTGCNRFQASGTTEPGVLVIAGPVATTSMACPGDELTAQESAILALLQGRIDLSYDPFSGELTLGKDDTVLVLTMASSEPEAEPETVDLLQPHAGLDAPTGEPRYLVSTSPDNLTIHLKPSFDSDVLTNVLSGTVLRNAGCSESDGQQWCQVSLPSENASGWVPSDKVETANATLRAGQDYFDATGKVPCAKGAGAPMTQCSFGVAR